ncbi:MAG: DUF542 domain-containing protein [Phycisphaerales bacterium]
MNAVATTPVGEIVTHQPGAATLFGRFGIDFCCGGKRPLAEACAKAGVRLERMLEELAGIGPGPERTWADATAAELVAHIQETHHEYLKRELPSLLLLLRKVADRHGGTHPELAELSSVFEMFAADMFEHMAKEEKVLFPAICEMEERGGGPSLKAPIECMEHDHEDAGKALARMRELTNGFTAPEGACLSLVGAYSCAGAVGSRHAPARAQGEQRALSTVQQAADLKRLA